MPSLPGVFEKLQTMLLRILGDIGYIAADLFLDAAPFRSPKRPTSEPG
jgi:hypothetical protein